MHIFLQAHNKLSPLFFIQVLPEEQQFVFAYHFQKCITLSETLPLPFSIILSL